MNSGNTLQKYDLRLQGLLEAKGEIKLNDLRLLLNAITKLTEASSRLIATGESKGRGKPKWLQESLNFTVKKIRKGSTVLEVEAPCLMDVAEEQFGQKEFWREPAKEDDTALDLAGYALQEILSENGNGDRYDSVIIDAALGLKKVAKDVGATFSLTPKGKQSSKVTLKPEDYDLIASKKAALPEPKSFTVSGRLEVIKHSSGQFVLELIDGQKLLGKLDLEFLDQADLKELWGKEVTTEGMVSFKANGQPRLIRSRKLMPKAEGDEIFQELPQFDQQDLFKEEREIRASDQATKPMQLWGLWGGDESIEELLSELK